MVRVHTNVNRGRRHRNAVCELLRRVFARSKSVPTPLLGKQQRPMSRNTKRNSKMPRPWTTLFRRFRSSHAPQGGRCKASGLSANRSRVQSHLEQLEPRQLLAAQFVINEFLASNGAGLL